jgi:ATP-binding cassette subfamily C protein
MKRNKNYTGKIYVGDLLLKDISEESLMNNFTYINHQSYLFKGTIRDNLLMGSKASDEELMKVLEDVKLDGFVKSENGLDTMLNEKASNLSGGQRQRLALARALLHNSPLYIFDESTSNIDVESENDIMNLIHNIAKDKTVIVISHRLANICNADYIYVLDQGKIAEEGTHKDLLRHNHVYKTLWDTQQDLESYTKGGQV